MSHIYIIKIVFHILVYKLLDVQSFQFTKQKFPTNHEDSRRDFFISTANMLTVTAIPSVANALTSKSRNNGYKIQHSEREWSYVLSGKQYNILREGGTEQPYSSILEGEDRNGEYKCAGCGTPLFTSSSKFHSGTGWPSFAAALDSVETEDVNIIQANLLGAEIRCAACGGHLGDVFNDGMIFVNTPAFTTGKRYCVDGSALIFKPSDGTEEVYGDLPPQKVKSSMM